MVSIRLRSTRGRLCAKTSIKSQVNFSDNFISGALSIWTNEIDFTHNRHEDEQQVRGFQQHSEQTLTSEEILCSMTESASTFKPPFVSELQTLYDCASFPINISLLFPRFWKTYTYFTCTGTNMTMKYNRTYRYLSINPQMSDSKSA